MAPLGSKLSEIHKNRIREAMKKVHIIPMSQKTKDKIRDSHLGKKHSIERRIKSSIAHKNKIVLKSGVKAELHRIRESLEYKLWREAVFLRDKKTCIWCNYKGKKLHADHIKPFHLYPELRFSIDNGRTLCAKCHWSTNVYWKKLK